MENCTNCRWRDEGECVLRGKPRRGPAGETRMPLPADNGEGCHLWTSAVEVWYDSPHLIRSSAAVMLEHAPDLPIEQGAQLCRMVRAGADRACTPRVPGNRRSATPRDIRPFWKEGRK